MTERTYTVTWQRIGESEILQCAGLDPRTCVARIISAIRESGPITIHSVQADTLEP